MIALLTLAALACGSAPESNQSADTVSTLDASSLPDTIPVVVMEQEGGVAGATSELRLYPTGEVTLAQHPSPGGIAMRRWTVSPAELEAVRALVRSAEFAGLEPEYLPEDPCCDRITYTVTVGARAGTRTVRTMDAAPQPDVLAAVIERLRALETTAPQ